MKNSMVLGLKRLSWLLAFAGAMLGGFIYWAAESYEAHSEAGLASAAISGVGLFLLVRMSIWVLRGFAGHSDEKGENKTEQHGRGGANNSAGCTPLGSDGRAESRKRTKRQKRSMTLMVVLVVVCLGVTIRNAVTDPTWWAREWRWALIVFVTMFFAMGTYSLVITLMSKNKDAKSNNDTKISGSGGKPRLYTEAEVGEMMRQAARETKRTPPEDDAVDVTSFDLAEAAAYLSNLAAPPEDDIADVEIVAHDDDAESDA